MTSRIVVLLAVLSTCMACPSSLPATEPTLLGPQVVDPEQKSPGVEERLAVTESQLKLILQDLQLMPVIATARLASIESQLEKLNDAVGQLQKDFKGIKPTGKKVTTPQPRQGKFIIRNWTGVNQYVSVNGFRYFVAPGRTEIMVPYTTVEAYLPSFEIPKLFGTWQWTGQNYEMFFDIRI